MEASDIDMPGSPVNNKEIGDDTIFEEPISGFDFMPMHFKIMFFNYIILFISNVSLVTSHHLPLKF